MTQCLHCGRILESGSACPNCGSELQTSPPRHESAMGPISDYFLTLKNVLSTPSDFFRKMSLQGGWGTPLAFALVTHWLGSALEYLIRIVLGHNSSPIDWRGQFQFLLDRSDIDSISQSALYSSARDRLLQWIWGVGPVILDPFLTLAGIFYTSFFIFMGARILVPREAGPSYRQVSFESVLRIVCFALAPAIFAAIPWVGGAITAIWAPLLVILAVREVYRIGTGRAVLIALFPNLLFLAILGVGISLVAIVFFKLFSAVFF